MEEFLAAIERHWMVASILGLYILAGIAAIKDKD